MIRLGEIEISLVSDGTVWVDAGGAFGLVPRALWSRYITPDDRNRVPMSLTCLLVRAGGRTIVVDTGLGDKLSERQVNHWAIQRPQGGLVDGLARLGVAPGDVDLVIDTHLHADHCGGNTTRQGDQVVPTFPDAEYWVQRLEYADAAFPNERTRATYLAENFEPLCEIGQLRLIDGEVEAAPGVRCVPTPGHTRGHQCIVLEGGGRSALFVADMASFAIHFERLAWMTAYDVEPLVTLETKRAWRRWALAHDALLIFEHDTQIPLGRLVEKDGEMSVISADAA
jgi:glyoxylase-like metal-dependent hydrolase (beta-lactamase superfamily II)